MKEKKGRNGWLGTRLWEDGNCGGEAPPEFPEKKVVFHRPAHFREFRGALSGLPLPRPGGGKLRQGRLGARSSGLGARPSEGTQASRDLRAGADTSKLPSSRPPRPTPDKAQSPRRERAGRLPRAPHSSVGARLRPAAPSGEPAPQRPGGLAGPAPNPHDVTGGCRPRPPPRAAGSMTSPRPHPSGASSVLAFISFLSSFRTFLASLAPRRAARAEPSLCSRCRGPAARRGRPPSTLQTRFHPAGQSARRGPVPGRPRPGTGHAVKPPHPVHLCPEPRAAAQCAQPAPGQERRYAGVGWPSLRTRSWGESRAAR